MFIRCAFPSLVAFLVGMANVSIFAGPIVKIAEEPYSIIRPVSAALLAENGSIAMPLSVVGHDGTGLDRPSPLRGSHGNDADTMVDVPFQSFPVTFQYDLGGLFDVHELWLWQYNVLGETDRGIQRFDVVFRDESGQIVGDLPSISSTRGNGDVIPANYYCPTAESVRFIDLVIRDNYGDDLLVGLSDIAFGGRPALAVPEPTTSMTLTSLLGLTLAVCRRRRNDWRLGRPH